MAIPISEKAGCVWCHENPPCTKVGFRLVCKPLLERNSPLVFCRGVCALLCLLRVINRVTNPHLFKVKDRSLGLAITNLFSVWPFCFKEFIGYWSATKHIAATCFPFFPGVTFLFPLLTVLFPQPYEMFWSHISLMSCIPQCLLGEIVSLVFLSR